MNILKVILAALFFFISLNGKSQITDFDSILGKENIKTLDYLISDFENDFLKTKYPDLETENAYRKYLTDIVNGNTDTRNGISQKSKNIFDKSQLRLEMYCVADSTWIESNPWTDKNLLVKARTRCRNPDGTFEKGAMEMPFDENEISRDSILKKYKTFVKANHNGKYLQALNSISNQSEFLKNFVDAKNDFGIIAFPIVAKWLLDHNVNLNDYYIKRIILLETAY